MGKYNYINTSSDFDQMFLVEASSALKHTNVTALEFLYLHQDVSTVQLAKLLNHGASALGLIMAIYKDAIATHQVRKVSKELLYREIGKAYPLGWSSVDEIGPVVRLIGWITEFKSNVQQQTEIARANRIYTDLVVDSQPAEGWNPQSAEDTYLIQLFDRHWPIKR